MAQADPSPKICRNNEKSGPEKAHDVAMKDLASTSQDQVVVDMAQADSSPRNNTAILVQQIPELGELRELMTSLNEKVDVIAATIQTSKDKGRGPMEIDGRQIANSHGCYVYNHCSFQTPRHSASHTLDEETDLKKEIVHVLECDAKFYKDHSESSWDGAYPIRHSSPKAHVLILNNYEGFKAGHERKGAKVDGELMKQLWEGFQCEVEVQENQTAKAMWNSLIKFSRSDKHKSCDFCVVIIMSHGNSTDRGHDYFCGIDDKPIKNDEVVKLFKNSKDRRYLIGKPKLIFFQSCRGASAAKGVALPATSDIDKAKLHDDDDRADNTKKEKVPEDCDILVAYPTVKGYVSFRNIGQGSWFINEIATVFSKRAKTEHVVDMLTEVRQNVCQLTANAPMEQFHECQVSTESKDTLRKKLYLFPGFPKTSDQ